MCEKQQHFFYLNSKEEAAMKVLWNSNTSLSAAQIAEGIPERNWPVSSIQSILRNLEKKDAIKVDIITKIGKSYGRLFKPTLSANEYAAMQFNRYYQESSKDRFSMISSLLGITSNNGDEIIRELSELLEKYNRGE